MKVAICFSGQPRSLNISIPSLKKNLIDIYDCDTFIWTWMNYNESERREGHYGKFEGTDIVGNGTIGKWSYEDFLFLQKELKPKIITVEEEKKFDKEYIIPTWSLGTTSKAIQSMFYSMKMCNDIKNIYSMSNSVEYDVVIKLRLDCYLREPLDLNQFDLTKINVSNLTHNIGINDFCAIGNAINMNTYCSIFSYLEQLNELNLPFNPEILLAQYLKLKSIPYKTHEHIKNKFPCIVRNDGRIIEN